VQVIRRLRSALTGVAEAVASESRTASVEQYLKQVDLVVDRSPLNAEDRMVASQEDRQGRQEDRQGRGLSRKRRAAIDQTQPQGHPPAATPATSPCPIPPFVVERAAPNPSTSRSAFATNGSTVPNTLRRISSAGRSLRWPQTRATLAFNGEIR
jgi:hypothetical protein